MDRDEAETYLWSLCQGYTGDGWTRWDNKMVNCQLQVVRVFLERYFDEDAYGRQCNAPCRSREEYGSSCEAAVSVDERRCHYHRNR